MMRKINPAEKPDLSYLNKMRKSGKIKVLLYYKNVIFMVDVLTPKQRSYNMSMIRSSGTKPEILLRDMLIYAGINSFKMHAKEIIGRPDFYFPDQKKVLFVDGCFWHGCKRCFIAPATNKKFWDLKIKSNLERDKKVNRLLKKEGIKIIRIREHDLKKEPEKVMEKVKTNLLQKKSLKVLDLFAGVGGFSEGFISAGCEIVAHIEMDKNACDTIRTRMVYHALRKAGRIDEYKKYLLGKVKLIDLINKYNFHKEFDSVIHEKIDRKNYPDLIKEVRQKLDGEQLDVIIGGPPCQAYSHIGRSSDKNHMKNDERNYLYEYYVEFLKALKPKIFVFENVPGLLSAGKGIYLKKMRQLMLKAGYKTDYKIIDASEFGVPQKRRRIILIGWNKKTKMKSYPELGKIKRDYIVSDFLHDLPKLKAGEGTVVSRYSKNSLFLRKLGIINPEIRFVTDHVSRPQRKQDLKIYRLAVKRKNKGKNIKYNELPVELRTHKNQTGFLDRFKVIDALSSFSHTIIAHISKDGHYYIHPDINQNRSLTVREAARLQTFSDDFKFEGSRTSQFKQIGNAVPPMLACQIANVIIKNLN